MEQKVENQTAISCGWCGCTVKDKKAHKNDRTFCGTKCCLAYENEQLLRQISEALGAPANGTISAHALLHEIDRLKSIKASVEPLNKQLKEQRTKITELETDNRVAAEELMRYRLTHIAQPQNAISAIGHEMFNLMNTVGNPKAIAKAYGNKQMVDACAAILRRDERLWPREMGIEAYQDANQMYQPQRILRATAYLALELERFLVHNPGVFGTSKPTMSFGGHTAEIRNPEQLPNVLAAMRYSHPLPNSTFSVHDPSFPQGWGGNMMFMNLQGTGGAYPATGGAMPNGYSSFPVNSGSGSLGTFRQFLVFATFKDKEGGYFPTTTTVHAGLRIGEFISKKTIEEELKRRHLAELHAITGITEVPYGFNW